MVLILSLTTAFAQAETSFVNVRNSQWNVVFRVSLTDTRIERMAAMCGAAWVNACSKNTTPEQRQAAFAAGLDGVNTMGDASSCRTYRLPRLEARELSQQVVKMDSRAFCEVLKPGSTTMMGAEIDPFETGFRGGAPDSTGPMVGLPAPTTTFPTPGPIDLTDTPEVTTSRQREVVRSPPPFDPLRRDDQPVVRTASSMEEFRLLELDDIDVPSDDDDDKKKKGKKKKKKGKDDEPTLKDRSLPR